jgi:hypothetical protein
VVILFAVLSRQFAFTFRLGTELISGDRRGTAEVSGEKVVELDDG